MASNKERVVQGFRTLDPRGTGAVPRAVFEVVMREVCQDSPARLEALGFAVPGFHEDEVRYEEFFEWIYGGGPAALRPAAGATHRENRDEM